MSWEHEVVGKAVAEDVWRGWGSTEIAAVRCDTCGSAIALRGVAGMFLCRCCLGECDHDLDGETPCPADVARPPGSPADHRRWGGNLATPRHGLAERLKRRIKATEPALTYWRTNLQHILDRFGL